jgi:hypothetical protein
VLNKTKHVCLNLLLQAEISYESNLIAESILMQAQGAYRNVLLSPAKGIHWESNVRRIF